MYYIISDGQLVSADKINERKLFLRETEWLMSYRCDRLNYDGTIRYTKQMAVWLPKSEVIYQENK